MTAEPPDELEKAVDQRRAAKPRTAFPGWETLLLRDQRKFVDNLKQMAKYATSISPDTMERILVDLRGFRERTESMEKAVELSRTMNSMAREYLETISTKVKDLGAR